MTVFENVAFPYACVRVPIAEIRRRVVKNWPSFNSRDTKAVIPGNSAVVNNNG